MKNINEFLMNTNQDREIFSLLPHRPPMLLIDTLHKASAEEIEAEVTITSECIFLRDDNSLEPAASLEVLAQCFASGSGFFEIKWGYLVSMRGMKVHGKAFLGDTLRAVVHPVAELEGIIVADGELYCKDKLLVSGQFKVYIPGRSHVEE